MHRLRSTLSHITDTEAGGQRAGGRAGDRTQEGVEHLGSNDTAEHGVAPGFIVARGERSSSVRGAARCGGALARRRAATTAADVIRVQDECIARGSGAAGRLATGGVMLRSL